MAFRFGQRRVTDPLAQQNFEQLEGINSDLEARLAALEELDDWHVVGAADEPAFANGWTNYGGSAGASQGDFATAAFYKDKSGRVHLRGLIKSGTIGSVVFTLPPGYRPAQYSHFPVLSNSAIGGVRVQADGGVYAGPEGSSVWLSLDGISFRAA